MGFCNPVFTSLKETFQYGDVSIDVYRQYSVDNGHCQCFKDCDCADDKGKVSEMADLYQATNLRNLKRVHDKPFKLCKSLGEAVGQYNNQLKALPNQ